MKLFDANVLLYAVDLEAPHHVPARTALNTALSGTSAVLLPWISLLAFVRLVTHPTIFASPMTTDGALDLVEQWLARPPVLSPPEPDSRHSARLRTLLSATGRGGNLVPDAHLAALALQHDAVVITFDNDFSRFPGVRWERPSDS